jgi:hypothetical protein
MRPILATAALAATFLLAGCEMLGFDSPEKVAAARDAEGRAIGGACRHAGRAIEDCFALNKRADKAAIFAGWRDMNDYMRENKIAEVPPQAAAPVAVDKPAQVAAEKAAEKAAPREADPAKHAKGKDS